MFDYLLQRKKKSGLKNLTNKKRCFLNYNSIQSVLIFFDAINTNHAMAIADDLKQNGKEVMLWTFYNDSTKFPPEVKVINPNKDLNKLKSLKPEIVSEFEKLSYDTFLDMSLDDNTYMEYLKIKNTSIFAIGFKENENRLYDFILLKEEHASLLESYEQVKFYLTNNI